MSKLKVVAIFNREFLLQEQYFKYFKLVIPLSTTGSLWNEQMNNTTAG